MSEQTLERTETFHLTDIHGNQADLLTIDGQPLEEYFVGAGLEAPVQSQVALVDGLPVDLKAPVKAGTSVSVGNLAKNG